MNELNKTNIHAWRRTQDRYYMQGSI